MTLESDPLTAGEPTERRRRYNRKPPGPPPRTDRFARVLPELTEEELRRVREELAREMLDECARAVLGMTEERGMSAAELLRELAERLEEDASHPR